MDFKSDKVLYQPGTSPVLVDVPSMRFITVQGQGDPNTAPSYAAAIEVLYGLSYTIKMSRKGSFVPAGYVDYTVGPLEGLWWFEGGTLLDASSIAGHKDELNWLAMIRQPEFVVPDVFEWAQDTCRTKKKLDVAGARLEDITEGLCAQVMHIGPYDDEPATIEKLDEFIASSGHTTQMSGRRQHHEIYLGDPRRTAPDKLRTIIRHPVVPV